MEPHVTNSIRSSALSSSTRLALPPHVSLQALGEDEGGVVLKLDTGEMYTINDTTLAFLQKLDGKRTVAEIVREMVQLFDVDEATLTSDLIEIADDLLGESLLVIAP